MFWPVKSNSNSNSWPTAQPWNWDVFVVIYGSQVRPGWVRWVKSDRHLLYEIRTAILSLLYGPVSLQIAPEKLSCSEPFPLQTHTFSSIKWCYYDGHGLTMGIIFFSHNGFWFPPFGKILATINTPRSHRCGSQTLLWAKMRPSVASGRSCQRSTGISKSQSLYCSPGYNGHMGLWPLSRSLLWTSEMVTKVWHTCDCGLNSFFLSRSCLFSDSWL